MSSKCLLIIRLSALGDVAMTVPAIYSVAQQYPSWTVKVLTQPFFSRLFINKPSNVRLLTADRTQLSSVKGFIKLINNLSKENIDVVADFHNIFRSWIIDLYFMLKWKKVRMLHKERMRRWRILAHIEASSPFIERYFHVLNRLGFNVKDNFRPFFQSRKNKTKDNAILIGVAPFARYENKTYPLPLMKEVVMRLLNMNYIVYLFGGKGREQKLLESMAKDINSHNIEVVAGHYSLEEELKLMAKMKLMVTMDSANMHLASLTGTNVISIWGGTTPVCGFMGYGQNKGNVICLNLECQPCSIAGSKGCRLRTMACLASIQPITIINKIEETMNRL